MNHKSRYTLTRQMIRIFAVIVAVAIVLTMNFADPSLFERIAIFLTAVVSGLLVSSSIPNRLIRWALDKQIVGGAFLLSLHIAFGLGIVILGAMTLSDKLRDPVEVLGGMAYYLLVMIPFILIVALICWYPMIATLHYLRQRRDFV